ncbi:MAG: recombination-associated protein RdgC [Bdellovibrionota bacterium]
MGLGSGSFALKRFRLLCHNKDTPVTWIAEKIQKFFISPLQLDDAKEESVGFCHPFTGEPNLNNIHSLVYDNSLLFALRFDKKKIPATFLRLQLNNALESLGHGLEDENGRTKKVSKKIKDNLKDKLKEELLRVTLPSIRIIEIMWNFENNEIWLFSTSAAVTEAFEKIFFEAFELSLVQVTAGTLNVDFDRLQLGLKLNLQHLIELVPVSLFHEINNLKDLDTHEKGSERNYLPNSR